jgi:DNA repair photolyase
VRDYVELFARTDGVKASFATKAVNRELLDWEPHGGTRVRFSLMPRDVSRLVDVRTHPVEHRIAAIDDFVAAGYEVHVNLSPVIVCDGWLDAWDELLTPAPRICSGRRRPRSPSAHRPAVGMCATGAGGRERGYASCSR